MTDILDYRFLLRGGLAAALASLNEVPLRREMIIELDNLFTTGKFNAKIGDGVTHYNDLPYLQTSGGIESVVAGTGISVDTSDAKNPIVSSNLGSIHVDERVPTYEDLPSEPGSSGNTYLVEEDGLIYIWSNGWPDEGKGVSVSPSEDSLTVALLHFDGLDGSTVFTNETGYGDGTSSSGGIISTSYSKFGGSSLRSTSTAQSGVTLPASVLWASNDDFTLECFVRLDSSLSSAQDIRAIASNRDLGSLTSNMFSFYFVPASGSWYLGMAHYSSTSSLISTLSTASTPLDIWHHCALVRRAGVFRGFVDGVQAFEIVSPVVNEIAHQLYIGFMINAPGGGSRSLGGNIDEFRIIKGSAKYWKNFTPPNSPFLNP